MDLPLLRRPGQDKSPLRSYRQVPIVAGNATWVSHFPQTLDLKHQHGMKLDHESEPLLAQPPAAKALGRKQIQIRAVVSTAVRPPTGLDRTTGGRILGGGVDGARGMI